MWDQLFQFLFNRNSILGWEYENWMLVIGLPLVFFFVYLSQRGWAANSAEKSHPPDDAG